jgi:Holliday junction resolvase RusA-like endonuclease
MANPFQQARGKQCAHCDKLFVALWVRQKYCSPCQIIKKSNLAQQGIRRTEASKTLAYAAVAESSSVAKTRLPGAFVGPDCEWTASFSVPYMNAASKNRRWAQMKGGRGIFVPSDVSSYSNLVAFKTKKALEGIKVYENKLWVSLFVQKPDHKSDAVNVVDTFCDAIKTVAGVDDRWFSLHLVDWEIKKVEPHIFVRIGQEDCFDARVCSHCGGVFPLDRFHKKNADRMGVGRECIECKSVVSLKRKELRSLSA